MARMGATVRGTKVGNGRGNPKHNMRDFTEEEMMHPDQANIDFDRTDLNVILKRETFEEAYNREFANVWDRYADERKKAYDLKLEKYETGQAKRKPRPSEHAPLKETPWEKYASDGNSQTHLEMEYIFHVGGHADFNTHYTDNSRKNIPTGLSQAECDARWDRANDILMDFCGHIEKKYPKMIGIQIDLHNDEGYPHVHWRGFFKADGDTFKQAGNSPYRALKEMGVQLPQKLPENQYKALFSEILRDDLDEVMKQHGWERENKLTKGSRKLEVFQEIEQAEIELENKRREIEREKRALADAKLKTKAEVTKQASVIQNIVREPDFRKLDLNLENYQNYSTAVKISFQNKQVKGKKLEKQTVIIEMADFIRFEEYLAAKNEKNEKFKGMMIDALENEKKQKYRVLQQAKKPFDAIMTDISDTEISIKDEKLLEQENEIEQLRSENITLKNQVQAFSMRFEREDEVDKENRKLKSENQKLKEENKILKNENGMIADLAIAAYEFSKKHKDKFRLLKKLEQYLEEKGIRELSEKRSAEIQETNRQRTEFVNLAYSETYELIRQTSYHDSINQNEHHNKNTWYNAADKVAQDNFNIPKSTSKKLSSHPYFETYVEEYKKQKPNLRYQGNATITKEIINENSDYIKNDIRHNHIDIRQEKWHDLQREYGRSKAELDYQPQRSKSLDFGR